MQPVQIGMNSALVLIILLLAVPLQLFLTNYVNNKFGRHSSVGINSDLENEDDGDILSVRKEAFSRLRTGVTDVVHYVQSTLTHYSKWSNFKELFLVPYVKGQYKHSVKTKKKASVDRTVVIDKPTQTTKSTHGKSSALPVSDQTEKSKKPKSSEKVKEREDEEYLYNEVYFAHSKISRSRRPPQVKLKVGQVVKHTKAGFYGVIVGWDEVAKAPEMWINKYYSNRPDVVDLPNYLVLVDSRFEASGNPFHYIPQEDMEVVEDNIQIQAPELSKYFEGYNNHRHLLRPWLLEIYPKDSQ